MRFELFWTDFEKKIFEKFSIFLVIFGQKSCFWSFSNFLRRSQETLLVNLSVFLTSVFPIRTGRKFSHFSLRSRKISKSQGEQKSTLDKKFRDFRPKMRFEWFWIDFEKKIFVNFLKHFDFLAKNHVFGHFWFF